MAYRETIIASIPSRNRPRNKRSPSLAYSIDMAAQFGLGKPYQLFRQRISNC
jgi:hypothetical protein